MAGRRRRGQPLFTNRGSETIFAVNIAALLQSGAARPRGSKIKENRHSTKSEGEAEEGRVASVETGVKCARMAAEFRTKLIELTVLSF